MGLVGGRQLGEGKLGVGVWVRGGGDALHWGGGMLLGKGIPPLSPPSSALPVSKKKQRQWIGPTGLNQTGEERCPPPTPGWAPAGGGGGWGAGVRSPHSVGLGWGGLCPAPALIVAVRTQLLGPAFTQRPPPFLGGGWMGWGGPSPPVAQAPPKPTPTPQIPTPTTSSSLLPPQQHRGPAGAGGGAAGGQRLRSAPPEELPALSVPR